MVVNYSKQNVIVERRIEGLSGGLSTHPRGPALPSFPTWMVILGDHGIKKASFKNFYF